MANYKRKRPRTSGGQKLFDRWKSKKLGDDWHWLSTWPRWWDILYHSRPHRRRALEVTRAVKAGKIDAEDATWPVAKKPHTYYW